MRARYSAFVTKQVDFLHQTLHPEHREDHDVAATRRWAETAQWLGLQVVETHSRECRENEAMVEFIATYKEGGIVKPHHEISRFVKVDDEWYYVEGRLVVPKTTTRGQPKVGRNDPCPCGSGKKYKKCCGA
jgi:SEC-C motif-containing protein